VALIAVLALTATVAGGCEYLLSAFGAPFPAPSYDPSMSFDPGASYDPNSSDAPYADPKPIGTFTKGTATLTVDKGAPITLDRLSPGPHVYQDYGTTVSWSSPDGWYLGFNAADYGSADPETTVILDRITNGQHWTAPDSYTACTVKLTAPADKTGVAGTASCHGLRWTDVMVSDPFSYEPTYVKGQDPFDVELSFSAS
jgi:hypothetical protein